MAVKQGSEGIVCQSGFSCNRFIFLPDFSRKKGTNFRVLSQRVKKGIVLKCVSYLSLKEYTVKNP